MMMIMMMYDKPNRYSTVKNRESMRRVV